MEKFTGIQYKTFLPPFSVFEEAKEKLDNLVNRLNNNKIKMEDQPKCPECLQPTPQDELDTFGGWCEECNLAIFAEDEND